MNKTSCVIRIPTKKQEVTHFSEKALKRLEFQGFGGDYRTRTSDLLRMNGLGKLFPLVSNPIQCRELRIQNYLSSLYHSVSAHSAPHCG